MLGGFGADEEVPDSFFATAGAAFGRVAAVADKRDGFGFNFGTADSLLTRTDAGTCIHARKRL